MSKQDIPQRFQSLFREHYASVARKIHALVSDRATAEDLAQEVFLRLYRKPPDDLQRVGAWLHRVAVNISYDYLREHSRRQELQKRELQQFQVSEDAVPSNEDIVIEHWEREVVRRVLQKLSQRDREALILKQQGFSYAEIAEQLKVSPKIMGTLLSRATDRFKRNFEQEEEFTHEQIQRQP